MEMFPFFNIASVLFAWVKERWWNEQSWNKRQVQRCFSWSTTGHRERMETWSEYWMRGNMLRGLNASMHEISVILTDIKLTVITEHSPFVYLKLFTSHNLELKQIGAINGEKTHVAQWLYQFYPDFTVSVKLLKPESINLYTFISYVKALQCHV